MNLELTSLDDPQNSFQVTSFPAVIGRSPDAELRVINKWASRFHCELRLADGVPMVRDLGSRHGTILNGEHITEAKLAPGDTLTVGLTIFEVSFDRALTEQPDAEESCFG